jgi:hypothetical protein
VTKRQEIPEAVRQLIADLIDSIAELETILLLRGHRDREWTAEEAGARLYVTAADAALLLSELAERGFLAERDQRYRYEPRTPELESSVDALASAYSTNLIGVTQLVHAKPAPGVLQFAKAFRLRKDS